MLYPEHFEEKIGFTPLRRMMVDLCDTPVGARITEEAGMSVNREEILRWLKESHEASVILSERQDFPDLAAVDLSRFIAKGMIEGAFLDVTEWHEIRWLLASVRQVVSFFEKADPVRFGALRSWVEPIRYSPVIHEKIDQVFNRQGEIRDQASPELKKIRGDIQSRHAQVTRSMERIMAKARQDGLIDKDTQATLREGRLVIPLPAAHKRSVKGLIHDESATGKTTYVEPVELVELNNEIRELELAERREIVKILTQLTSALRPYFPDMERWNGILGYLDHIRSRARLSNRWSGILPGIMDDEGIAWTGARHPHLFLVFQKEGREVVTQDITLTSNERILIISGPNAGGKSVCMKTVGLVQYMIQSGILPPLTEGSASGVFSDFLIDIGDEQSLENDLSTYSSHLHHMKNFLRMAKRGTLFLIDEFGAGTEPQMGGAIAEAILSHLTASGAFGVITTHYANLKHFGSHHNGVVNGAMLFDTQKMRPMFRLEIGKPGSSFAFEIARNIGLPEQILEAATELVGPDHTRFDRNLREIARDKRYWERKRDKIRLTEKELEKLLERYGEEADRLKRERDSQVRELKAKSGEIVEQLNRRIEQTIREIRESQADREKTRALRTSLENDLKAMQADIGKLETEGLKQRAKVNQERERLQRILKREPEAVKPEYPDPETGSFRPGQKIRVASKGIWAEVIEHRKGSLLVSVGQMITTVNEREAEAVSEEEFNKETGATARSKRFSGIDLEYRRLNFSPQLDIRGMRGDEALQRVTEFMDEAVMVGERNLRILHGKGDGILRQLVRDFLSGIDLVDQFKDEDIRVGGTGVTLVRLSF